MIYCSKQLHNGFSSSELLMNQRLCTTLPILESQLQPSISGYRVVCETMRKANSNLIYVIEQIASYFRSIAPGEVWMSGRRDSGVIVEQSQSPRS